MSRVLLFPHTILSDTDDLEIRRARVAARVCRMSSDELDALEEVLRLAYQNVEAASLGVVQIGNLAPVDGGARVIPR